MGKIFFTNKFSSSGIYQYFNSSVRRVKAEVFSSPGHCALAAEGFSTHYSGLDTVHWKQKCSQLPTLAQTLCNGS